MKTKLGKRKCKQCGEVFQKTKPLQYVCSLPCAIAYGQTLKREEAVKSWKDKKKKIKESLKTYSQRVQEVRKVFQEYIRERDKDKPCICCGEQATEWDAGHYLPANTNPALIFNEDNVWKQRVYCNRYLSGNQLEYRKGLIERIGIKRVEALEAAAIESKHIDRYKYSNEELERLKTLYLNKLKELRK